MQQYLCIKPFTSYKGIHYTFTSVIDVAELLSLSYLEQFNFKLKQ